MIDVETGEIVRLSTFDQRIAEATTPAEIHKIVLEIKLLLKIAKEVGEKTERINELQIGRIDAIREGGGMLKVLPRGKTGPKSELAAVTAANSSAYRLAYEEAQISDRLARLWQEVFDIPQEVVDAYEDECIATGSEISLLGLLIFAKRSHVANNRGGDDIPDDPDEVTAYELGDIVHIGKHLFICEDNTSALVREVLASRAPYQLAFCDIPYNANVADWDRGGFVWTQDYLADLAAVVAVTPGIGNLHNFMQQTQMPYRWSTSTHISNGMTRGALGFGNWIYTALFSKQSSIHRNAQDASIVAISSKDADGLGAKRQKPPRYLAWLFRLFTSEGDCILDPFAGSGTSAIVADRLKCSSINVERDPDSFSRLVARVSNAIQQPVELGE